MTESSKSSEIQFPEMSDSEIDESTLSTLFEEVQEHTQILDIKRKQGRRQYADEGGPIPLGDAALWLRSSQQPGRAIQLRYRFADAEFWDTIIGMGGGVYRIVRVRHDWEAKQ